MSMQASLLVRPEERSNFILSVLKHLCRERRFQHQWRTADHLATLCHKWFVIPELLRFDGNDLSNVLRKDPALKLDIKAEKSSPNQFGIYHDIYRPRREDGNRRNAHCYYLCDPDGNECVTIPPVGKWYDTIPSLLELQKECDAIARSSRTARELPPDVIDIVSRARHLAAEERPRKRTRLEEAVDNSSTRLSCSEPPQSPALSSSTTLEVVISPAAPKDSSQPAKKLLPPGTNIYWDSADARLLFNASDNETSLDRLDDLIEVLENVNQLQSVGYKTILSGHDPDDSLSEYKKTEI